MATYKLTLAYDGTRYAGWQLQPKVPTVQGELERALKRITGQEIRVTGSSRTDSGVHAVGQVVGFRLETKMTLDVLHRALNHHLPDQLSVSQIQIAPDDFHAIRHAVRKRYRYILHDGMRRDVFRRQYSWQYWKPLDAVAMHQAAQSLVGTHDFRSFETNWPTRASSVRTIFDLTVRRERLGEFSHWAEQGMLQVPLGDAPESDYIYVEVEADGFLYNMVRTIVGTLLEIGRGAQSVTWAGEVLHAQDRRRAGRTAPPQGLFLLWIKYPGD